jgi:hypothetical protein
MKRSVHFWSYLAQFFVRMRNVTDKSCRENQNTRFILNFFFLKSFRLWDNVEEYSRAVHATDDYMAHVNCMLGTEGHKHTHRLCNTCCFSNATVVIQTRLILLALFLMLRGMSDGLNSIIIVSGWFSPVMSARTSLWQALSWRITWSKYGLWVTFVYTYPYNAYAG